MTKIVAVTACITGIAHTFMAEANFKRVAKERGIEIKFFFNLVIGSSSIF